VSAAVTDPRAAGVESVGVTQLEARAPVAGRSIPVFREVYEAHVELVFRTLRRVGVPAAAVDDVAQEVFLSVHGALGSWEGRSTLRTWIYRIARNAGLNHLRSVRRRPDGPPTDLADEMAHGAADPESRAQTYEALGELNAMLARIDEPKREVLVLMELEEFSAPEVAELLAIPLNTVYSRLRLGRAELERLLAEAESA
jgi:RNA polymerase sigma-70 factor (ECF subfamily)